MKREVPTFSDLLLDLTEDDVEAVEERAAIFEYEAGMTRVEAEAAAVAWWEARS